ncbi:MAG: hypothetical protein AB1714_20445 [Acidobacteriota bacterium]
MKDLKALVSIIICVALAFWLLRYLLPVAFAAVHLVISLAALVLLVLLVFYFYKKVMRKL